MNVVLGCLALLNYLGFMLAARFFFKKVDRVAKGMKWISLGAIISAITFTFSVITYQYNSENLWQAIVGAILFCLSFGLFAWSIQTHRQKISLAFSNDLPNHLVMNGPYRMIRHPFYTSYTISYLAGYLATLHIYLVPLVVAMVYLYYHASDYEEKKFAASHLAQAYEEYKQKTGRFFPKLM